MEFKEVNLGAKYFKYKECKKGDVLVKEGKYVETYQGKYGSVHKFKEADGQIIGLNKAGQLDRLIEEHLEVGDVCRIIFDGTETIAKGDYAGKPANMFKLMVAETSMKEAAPKVEETVADTTSLDDLE